MGKTPAAAKAEALKCAKGFRYAENLSGVAADEPADAAKVGRVGVGLRPIPAARGGLWR